MKDEFRWMLEWITSKGLEASDLSTWWSAEQAYEAYKAELIAKNHRDLWIMLYAAMNSISIEAAEEARQAYLLQRETEEINMDNRIFDAQN